MRKLIKNDNEAGVEANGGTRPYIRDGLPGTVVLHSSLHNQKGYVMLTPEWMDYVAKVNDTKLNKKYMFDDWEGQCNDLKEAVGWHNEGKGNRVEQLAFSGNPVEIDRIEGNKAYVKCFYNTDKPPVEVYKPMPNSLHPIVHLLSTQFPNRLDMSTDMRYPRTFIIANSRDEELWIDLRDLKDYNEEVTQMDYVIGYDYWEGNPDIDETQIAGIIKYLIPRLNDMNGGHHMDELFTKHWYEARNFPRFFYFVYNPWKDGLSNWNWMIEHMPKDTPPRFSVDIEVVYPGYSASNYALQVDTFLQKALSAGMKPVIYTGYWFLKNLSTWPKYVDYWWARYPDAAKPSSSPTTFTDLQNKMSALTWAPDPIYKCPGNVAIWQVSDKWVLPGQGNHAVDINLWGRTYQDLLSWIGGTPVVEPPVTPPTTECKIEALKAEIESVLEKY